MRAFYFQRQNAPADGSQTKTAASVGNGFAHGRFFELEVPPPQPRPGDLLVRVAAVGLNPIDYKLRRLPWQPEESQRLLGFDVCGTVEAVGCEVTAFKVGDRVFYAGAFNRPGAYASHHVVDARLVALAPDGLDAAECAALPLTLLTAWEGLFERLLIPTHPAANAGKSLLLIGAAGGMGSIAAQLAANAGLTVIGTVGRPASHQWCKDLGINLLLDHHQPLAGQLRDIGVAQVDYVFNCNDTSRYWNILPELLRPMGRVCLLVDATGPVDINLYKRKSIGIEWEFMGARSIWPDLDMAPHGRILQQAASELASGRLRTTLNQRLQPASAELLATAHAELESGTTIGKTVILI